MAIITPARFPNKSENCSKAIEHVAKSAISIGKPDLHAASPRKLSFRYQNNTYQGLHFSDVRKNDGFAPEAACRTEVVQF